MMDNPAALLSRLRKSARHAADAKGRGDLSTAEELAAANWAAWVERKIAEEKVTKVHMDPTPHILITPAQADAIKKVFADEREKKA